MPRNNPPTQTVDYLSDRTKKQRFTGQIIPVNFSLPDWQRGMDEILGTKVADPLIRWSQRGEKKPTTACRHCGVHYTTLGISRHEGKCPFSPKAKNQRARKSPR